MQNFKAHCFVGGGDVAKDVDELAEGVHVAVGTTGRLLHMLTTGKLKCDQIKMLILDEADEMLQRGFAQDVA